MDIKRKCADEAGASANKRCKSSTNDETDEIDPNSLVGMPDEMLDEIFDFLELSDRKSLSETCKRLNGYFSQVRNLRKVWINVIKAGRTLTKPTMMMSSRRLTHCNVICDVSNSKKTVEYFSSSSDNNINMKGRISALRIQQQADVMLIVTHLLPSFFANLTHLEFTSITDIRWGKGITKLSSKLNSDRVAMPHLEFLAIYRNLFAFLDRHYIDFSTEKLHTIKVSDDFDFSSSSWYCDAQARSEDQLDIDNRIRVLIAKQKNLKVLILSVSDDFFDRELIVQSKLKTLRLERRSYSRRWMHEIRDSEQTRKNFVDFIVSQTELEDVDVEPGPTHDDHRLRTWRQNRLNSRVKVMRISWSSDDNVKSLNSANESMLAGAPNLAVRKLKLITVENGQQASQQPGVIAAIASKFPKIQMMHLNVGYGLSNELSMLNRLEELIELHVGGCCKGLRTFTLPKLRCFGFRYPYQYEHFKVGNFEALVQILQQFLVRHPSIKEIHIDIFNQQNFINWLEFVLTRLKHIKLIVFRNSELQLSESFIVKISSLIAAHAQPGFRVINNKLKFMKRGDEKVVLEIDGRWKIDE